MKKEIKYRRHGDISLQPVSETEGEIVKHEGRFVLAEGETTGHKHVLTVEKPTDLEIRKTADGRFYFDLKASGRITHQEHREITIMPGIYEMTHEREKDWFSLSVRRVLD